MSNPPHKVITDENWSQLITLTAGFLPLEGGDVEASMSRALAAHARLISALKAGRISAELPGGRVTMFVPDEGGVALRTERAPRHDPTQQLIDAPTEVPDFAEPPPPFDGDLPEDPQ